MQSLEVVRPGDGLSTVPSATPYWRDGRRQRRRRHTVAAGQWRRFLFGWGTAGGGDGGTARAFEDDGLGICVIVIRLVSYIGFFLKFGLLYFVDFVQIRPNFAVIGQ
jgi:hypothetical protein